MPPKLMCFAGCKHGGIKSQRVGSEQGDSIPGCHNMFSITTAWQKPFLNAMMTDALSMPRTQSYWIREHANLAIMQEPVLYEGHSYPRGNCLPTDLTVAA